MIKFVVGILMAIISGLSAYALSDKKISDKISSKLRPKQQEDSEGITEKVIDQKKAAVISALNAIICGAVGFRLMMHSYDAIYIIKILFAVYLISLCSITDYKAHRIPNLLTAILAIIEAALLFIGKLADQQYISSYIFGAAFSCIAVVIFLSLASFLSKGGLGLGDIKLLAAFSLLGDIYLLCSTIIISMIGCSLVGIILIIAKKRSIKDGLPYAPFMFVGLAISVFLI